MSSKERASPQGQSYAIVDVQAVSIEQPLDAVRTGIIGLPDMVVACDILVVGGGMGGTAAALQASGEADAEGKALRVVLTEETDWLGGQMTAQGVSALDENYLVESSGATRSYRAMRTKIRQYYKGNYQMTPSAMADPLLNPGTCWVTRLAFEPIAAVRYIDELLAPAIESGRLSVHRRFKPIYACLSDGTVRVENGTAATETSAASASAQVKAIGMLDLRTDEIWEFHCQIVIDATELGDLLPLCGVAYRQGSDSRAQTGEPHAPEQGDAENVQDYTYPFAVEYRQGENHKIEKPPHYDDFNKRGKFSFQGYKMFADSTITREDGSKAEVPPFWTYRRLLDSQLFEDIRVPFDIAMINWDSNDMRGMNIVGCEPKTQAERLALAKSLSLGFLYWLQNEAQRDDGGSGYAELMLLPNIMETKDGLSKYPYIRECRRVKSKRFVAEEDIVAATNSGARARLCPDSAGIGLYPVDIHGLQEIKGAAQQTKPFQVPLSAIIPEQDVNLLPACKNIGTTHITNGAYRLHPIEWAIGEAQGLLAAYCIRCGSKPGEILADRGSLRRYQSILGEAGIPIFWFDDVDTEHPSFAAIQYLAVTGALPGNESDLHFRPGELISELELKHALSTVDDVIVPSACHTKTRAEFADWLYAIFLSKPVLARNNPEQRPF